MANKSRDAFIFGIDQLIDNTLPSIWDEHGMGWHEQWQTDARFSGIYASCEGLILLSLIKDKHRNIEVKRIINDVYSNHLCKTFDIEYIIDESRPWALAKNMQRERAINLCNKLSKFLLASAYVDQDCRDEKLLNAVIHRLSSLFVAKEKQFKPVPDREKTSLSSTVFAFIALKNFLAADNEIFLLAKERLMEILGTRANASNFISVILSTWAVSESLDMFDDEQKRIAADALIKALNCQTKGDVIWAEKFHIVDIIHLDTFSLNKCLMYMHTLISFIKAGLLDFDYIKLVLGDIQKIVETIQSIGMYSQTGEKSDVLFWENYQALLLIKNLYELIKDREGSFMIISPKFFSNHEFNINENLVAILMPFNEDWSDKTYEAFIRAVDGYDHWRSDKDHSDTFIMQQIWDKINQAKFVIADCTGKNPNVFYELGIAHTLGKSVFMCAQDRKDFPFDISHINSFVYNQNDILQLITEIESFIKEL